MGFCDALTEYRLQWNKTLVYHGTGEFDAWET